jgi:hypothetical protein
MAANNSAARCSAASKSAGNYRGSSNWGASYLDGSNWSVSRRRQGGAAVRPRRLEARSGRAGRRPRMSNTISWADSFTVGETGGVNRCWEAPRTTRGANCVGVHHRASQPSLTLHNARSLQNRTSRPSFSRRYSALARALYNVAPGQSTIRQLRYDGYDTAVSHPPAFA